MALCFDCVMAVVEQVVNAFTTRNCSWFTLFSLWFFSGTSMLLDSCIAEAPLHFLFGFLFRKTVRAQTGVLRWFSKAGCVIRTQGQTLAVEVFSFVLACVIVGVVLSMSHCWLARYLVIIAPFTTLRHIAVQCFSRCLSNAVLTAHQDDSDDTTH